jgi:hypothetical protein
MLNGNLEVYSAQDPSLPASLYRGTGRCLVQPIITGRAVAWPTDRGTLYVAPAYRQGLWYRVEGSHPVTAAPAYSNRTLYLPSANGFIYAIDELSGSIVWTYSTGEPLSQAPVAIDDVVYVVGDTGNLYCLSADLGQLRWSCSDVHQFLAHGSERLYCVGRSDNLLVLQPETGSLLTSSRERLPAFRFTNTQTDRIYVSTPSGLMQCFREASAEFPVMHVSAREDAETPASGGEATSPETETMNPTTEPIDPFGTPMSEEENPFDASEDEPADPFGTDRP